MTSTTTHSAFRTDPTGNDLVGTPCGCAATADHYAGEEAPGDSLEGFQVCEHGVQVTPDVRCATCAAADQLAATSTEALLRAAYALTHRIHETEEQHQRRADGVGLRAQRDLITAEVIRRAGA